jgi:hypothetical protein
LPQGTSTAQQHKAHLHRLEPAPDYDSFDDDIPF